MRRSALTICVAAAAVVAACSFGIADDISIVADPANPNDLHTTSSTHYYDSDTEDDDPDAPDGDESDDSGSQTIDATSQVSVNDGDALNSVVTKTTVYYAANVAMAAQAKWKLIDVGEDPFDPFSDANAGDSSDPCTYYGIITSGSLPAGTPCTLSGEIDISWAFGGTGWARRTGYVLIRVSDGGTAFLQLSNDGGSLMGYDGSNWHSLSTNPDGDSQAMTFAFTSSVGASISVEYYITTGYGDVSFFPGDWSQDVLNLSVPIYISL
jgi:hypothetical protein